jgi:hypothetical protein
MLSHAGSQAQEGIITPVYLSSSARTAINTTRKQTRPGVIRMTGSSGSGRGRDGRHCGKFRRQSPTVRRLLLAVSDDNNDTNLVVETRQHSAELVRTRLLTGQ